MAVAGDSMWPVLRSGDAVLCEPVAQALPGDIVVARLPHGIIAHRVKAWSARAVVLRGDASFADDVSINAQLVLGRVTRVRRNGVEYALRDLNVARPLLGRARLRLKRLLSRVTSRLSR